MIEFLIGTVLGLMLGFAFCAVLASAKLADQNERKRER